MWIEYDCPRCGAHGNEEVEGMQMQGCCIEVHQLECPECGLELYPDGDEEWEDDEEEE